MVKHDQIMFKASDTLAWAMEFLLAKRVTATDHLPRHVQTSKGWEIHQQKTLSLLGRVVSGECDFFYSAGFLKLFKSRFSQDCFYKFVEMYKHP